jgi:hypothetical protein
MSMMPSSRISKVAYRNNHDLTFKDVSAEWNMNQLTNAHGLTIADLDLDGDLDVVMNNMNEPVSVYENQSTANSVRLKLRGPSINPMAVGARVRVTTADGNSQVQDLYLSRGYLSSVEPILHFGIGDNTSAQVEVFWPDGQKSYHKIDAPGLATLSNADAVSELVFPEESHFPFQDVREELKLEWRHQENEFNDFARELLIPHKQSENGPYISVGDADGDGLEDFYVGGSKDHSGMLFFQNQSGFVPSGQVIWYDDRVHEDAESLFFDADGDGDLDLYVVSGGNEEPEGSAWYQDRLYINNGSGTFANALNALPQTTSSGSVVIASDVDGDRDLDLFVGGRVVPGGYPAAPQSYLLINEGSTFRDGTDERAPGLSRIGMVTDAVFSDYDGDGDQDLLLVGEWMPLVIFRNDGGSFVLIEAPVSGCTSGWWFSINDEDLDADGDPDYVLGNVGLNNKFHPNQDHPLKVYANDFDNNGTTDIVLAKASGDSYYPVRGRQCSSQQMPFILEKCPTYKSFSESTVEVLYEDGLDGAIALDACEMASMILMNSAGSFTRSYLPNEAQASPLTSTLIFDVNGDGRKDILGAGNFFGAEVETVRYDAGLGIVLTSTPDGFTSWPLSATGFYVPGNVHDMALIHLGTAKEVVILVGNNNSYIQAIKFLKPSSR